MAIFTTNLPFKIQSVPASMYVFVRRWVNWAEIPTFYNDNLQRIAEAMMAADVPPQYPPSKMAW